MSYYSLRKVKPAKISLVKWVFTSVGLIFVLIGCHQLYGAYRFTSVALPVEATVEAVERKVSRDSDGRRSTTYRPTVVYRDAYGATRTARTYLSSNGYNFEVGSRIAVLYDPDDPSTVRVDSFASLWVFGAVFSGMGALFVILGLYLKPSMGAPPDDDDASNSKGDTRASDRRTPSVRRR